ncbi:uncharacterized protein LOC125544796 isoform X1 [Triticum urartu]|nr:uncharacterized protein LOC125544796 isoform X1 [Triticum urartu]
MPISSATSQLVCHALDKKVKSRVHFKDMDDYLKGCRFLPKLNNKILGERNAPYKERLSSLENLVLIRVQDSDRVLQDNEMLKQQTESMTPKCNCGRLSLSFLFIFLIIE